VPFALAGLGAVALAVILYLLVEGVVYLIRAIAAQLPNFDIFFIPVHLADWFKAAAQPVVSFLTTIANGFVYVIELWFRAVAWMFTKLFDEIIGVTAHHASQIEYLNNQGIPLATLQAINAADRNTAAVAQGIRNQVHAAQVKWENAHSYADAVNYIDAERVAPSVENADLALAGRTLIAAENHAQDLHDQLKSYVDAQVTGVTGTIDARITARVAPIERAIAIPWGTAIPGVDLADLVSGAVKVGVGTAVAVIASEFVKCAVTSCDGNNNFGKLLQDALGLVSLAEFAQFVEAFINDPAGQLNQYVSDAGVVFTGAEKTTSDVWGSIEHALGL
jgi:predicted transcriptional regulator